jgi:hypothetical protein
MEPDVPDSCPADGCLPARLETKDRLAFKGEDQTGTFLPTGEQSEDSLSQWNFAGFALGRLAMRDIQEPPVKIHVFPSLVEYLAPPHPGVESKDRDRPQMGRCGREELRFLGEAQNRFLLAALTFEPDTGDGVCGKNALIHRPIEQVTEALDVAVDGRFGELLFRVPLFAVASDEALRDPADLDG